MLKFINKCWKANRKFTIIQGIYTISILGMILTGNLNSCIFGYIVFVILMSSLNLYLLLIKVNKNEKNQA